MRCLGTAFDRNSEANQHSQVTLLLHELPDHKTAHTQGFHAGKAWHVMSPACPQQLHRKFGCRMKLNYIISSNMQVIYEFVQSRHTLISLSVRRTRSIVRPQRPTTTNTTHTVATPFTQGDASNLTFFPCSDSIRRATCRRRSVIGQCVLTFFSSTARH